jgi:threonine synthase
MNFEVPDYIVVPTSLGRNIRDILKKFEEFELCGPVSKAPGMICAQVGGRSPIYKACINNKETISPIENPHTIGHAIENPYPPSGNELTKGNAMNENATFVFIVTGSGLLHSAVFENYDLEVLNSKLEDSNT